MSSGKGNVVVLVVIAVVGGFVLLGGIVALLIILPSVKRTVDHAREGAAKSRLTNLDQATRMYQLDFGAYPENGPGTTTLSRRLRSLGPKKLAYHEFQPGDLDSQGNVRNPIDPEKEIFHYRNNHASPPQAHNKRAFDLWGRDAKGREEGINNWGE